MKLFDHQQKGVDFIIKNKGAGAFFWDMGTGKTLAAIKVFERMHKLDEKRQLLVICPLSLIESAWMEDIKKFTNLSCASLRDSPNIKAYNILIINYEAIISRKFQKTWEQVLALKPMCVLDESQKIKAYNAKTTKALLKAAPAFPYKIVMSATPAPNIESEYWSQMCFLAPRILGNNFFKFRNKYMALCRGATIVPLYGLGKREIMMMLQRGYTMGIHPDMLHDLRARMKPYCQYIAKRDVLDLPDEINVNRFVTMTKEQTKAYRDMWDELVMEIDGTEISVNIALAKIMKVRQITGGFAYTPNAARPAFEFKDNPKMKELENVIEEIGPRRSVIVFCQYKWEIEKITEIFKERATALYSDTPDRNAAIRKFKQSTNGILVSHPASGGVGLSFNDCDYTVFYSLSYSFLEYYQARGRSMRANKKNNATYIHLIARDSIDEVIMGALLRKEDNHTLFRGLMK